MQNTLGKSSLFRVSASSRPESSRYESATNQFIYEGIVQAADESQLQKSPGKPEPDHGHEYVTNKFTRADTSATLAIDYSEMCLQAEKLRFEKLELE